MDYHVLEKTLEEAYMRKTFLLLSLLSLILLVQNTFATIDQYQKQMNERLSSLATADKTLENLAIQSPPKQLTKSEINEWRSQTQWLSVIRKRFSDYKVDLVKVKQGESMEDHMRKLNMQFHTVQEATLNECRNYHTRITASKSRNDMAMMAIRNMK